MKNSSHIHWRLEGAKPQCSELRWFTGAAAAAARCSLPLLQWPAQEQPAQVSHAGRRAANDRL